jgi:predicted PurR-regulated permease PerM
VWKWAEIKAFLDEARRSNAVVATAIVFSVAGFGVGWFFGVQIYQGQINTLEREIKSIEADHHRKVGALTEEIESLNETIRKNVMVLVTSGTSEIDAPVLYTVSTIVPVRK